MDDLWKEGNEERRAGQAASRGARLQMGALMFKHEIGTRWYLGGWGTENRQSRSLEQEGQKQWYSESLTYVFIQMPHILGALQGSHGRYSRVLEMNEWESLPSGGVWCGSGRAMVMAKKRGHTAGNWGVEVTGRGEQRLRRNAGERIRAPPTGGFAGKTFPGAFHLQLL